VARIMRACADRPIAKITSAEIERFLRGLDREGLTGRNVNANRQLLANVFEYATRPDAFALPSNPVREEDFEQQRFNRQDAAIYTVAGFTGLRQGELRALRWRYIRFANPHAGRGRRHLRRLRVDHEVREMARRPAHPRGVRRARRAQPARMVHRPR
jgi:integrase